MDKAATTSERLKGLDPPRYYSTQAELAKKKKDFGSAEQHLRKAVELADGKVGRLLELASFLAEQQRYEESDALFEKAVK